VPASRFGTVLAMVLGARAVAGVTAASCLTQVRALGTGMVLRLMVGSRGLVLLVSFLFSDLCNSTVRSVSKEPLGPGRSD